MTTLGIVPAIRQSLARLSDLGVASAEALIRIFSPSGLANFVGGAVDDRATDVRSGTGVSTEDNDSRILSIYGIGRLGSAMFESGAYNYLWFWVYINVFFGVFNLVPVLPLDGGHIAIATYERLRSWRGRQYRADVAKLIPLTWVVVTLLIGVTLVALYRDIVDFPDFG
jgi:Zn-dependent protease